MTRTARRAATGIACIALAVLAAWFGLRAAGRTTLWDAPERMRCDLPAAPASPHIGMVWVPAGRVDMGDTIYPEEGPVHTVEVAGFWIDRTEVTNDEFAAFVAATGHVTQAERAVDAARHPELPPDMRKPGAVVFHMPREVRDLVDPRQWWRYVPGADWRHPGGPETGIAGRGAFPVTAIAYADALAYAKWKGRSLPTEAQWEWAARGAAHASGDRTQPREANTWQGGFPVANSAADGFVGLAPVGCFAPNARGLFDMIGNAWEWTADAWTRDHRSRVAAPVAGQRVIKGGSYLCAPEYCLRYRPGARQPQEEDLATSHLGFRTVLNAPGP